LWSIFDYFFQWVVIKIWINWCTKLLVFTDLRKSYETALGKIKPSNFCFMLMVRGGVSIGILHYSCSKQEKRRTEPNRYPQTLEPNRSVNLLFLSEPNRTEPLTWDSRTEPIREPHNFYRTEPRISADNHKFKFKSNSNQ
jgi:hypothetical protein